MLDEQRYAVLVIGGGPAGMSAAIATSEAGLRTLLVDERPTLGGQIFKQPGPGFRVADRGKLGRQWRFGRDLIDRAERSPAQVLMRTAVVDLEPGPDGWTAILHTDGEPVRALTVSRIIVAAGAHDRPVVFPGWTLPGVVTAGGLQTLAKTQRMLPGKRMVFAGSGPVALAFPAQLAGFGADIVVALEAGPTPRPVDVARVAGVARGNASLLRDAVQYRGQLLRHRIPLRYGRIVVRAEGDRRVQRVVHAAVDTNWRVQPGTEETVEADLLCLGYGFVSSPELLRLSGCAFDDDEDLGGPVVRRDSWCRTTVSGIYAAGDGTGVEGSYVAIDEGTITGVAVAMDAARIDVGGAIRHTAPARRRLSRRRALTAATARMYRVGPGIYELAGDSTVVCRCEEVRTDHLDEAMARVGEISAVKAVTRAGMGPCQGRNCQRHIAAMLARRSGQPIGTLPIATPRMPVRPVPISAMADRRVQDPGLFVAPDEKGAPVG
ncbi:MAG: FAD-dependent oxidoreductase [Nakamurella sp.]